MPQVFASFEARFDGDRKSSSSGSQKSTPCTESIGNIERIIEKVCPTLVDEIAGRLGFNALLIESSH